MRRPLLWLLVVVLAACDTGSSSACDPRAARSDVLSPGETEELPMGLRVERCGTDTTAVRLGAPGAVARGGADTTIAACAAVPHTDPLVLVDVGGSWQRPRPSREWARVGAQVYGNGVHTVTAIVRPIGDGRVEALVPGIPIPLAYEALDGRQCTPLFP